MMTIVRFKNPPLIEVVLAIQLEDTNFSSVHFGLYWQAIRERFPLTVDRLPIINSDTSSGIPPLRRALFLSSDDKKMLQIQDNFFSYNWRHSNQNEYPHFETIFADFGREWEFLQKWWLEIDGSALKPSGYQLTYLNLIDEDSGWESTKDHHKIFTFIGNNWDDSLGTPELQDTRLVVSLPNEQGVLTVELDQRQAEEDDYDFLLFSLTIDTLELTQPLATWFQIAHDYIVKAFLVFTTKNAHDKWDRYDN